MSTESATIFFTVSFFKLQIITMLDTTDLIHAKFIDHRTTGIQKLSTEIVQT